MGNKYGYNGAGGNMGGGGSMQSLMKQAQQMQQKLVEAQQSLEEKTVTGTAAGGLVEVEANCKKVISAVHVKSEACDPDDVEMLEDLILAAINDAYAKASEEEEKVMAPFAAMKGLM